MAFGLGAAWKRAVAGKPPRDIAFPSHSLMRPDKAETDAIMEIERLMGHDRTKDPTPADPAIYCHRRRGAFEYTIRALEGESMENWRNSSPSGIVPRIQILRGPGLEMAYVFTRKGKPALVSYTEGGMEQLTAALAGLSTAIAAPQTTPA
jgi:hypothetical protein